MSMLPPVAKQLPGDAVCLLCTCTEDVRLDKLRDAMSCVLYAVSISKLCVLGLFSMLLSINREKRR